MALQLVAIKIYGDSNWSHLDPRYVLAGGGTKITSPFEQLYRQKLLPFAVRRGFLDKSRDHGGIGASPRTTASAAAGSTRSSILLQSSPPVEGSSRSSAAIRQATAALRVDHKALLAVFKAYAVQDAGNDTGVLRQHGLCWNELAVMARECGIVPQILNLSALGVVFREHRERRWKENGTAHVGSQGFVGILAAIAVRFVHSNMNRVETGALVGDSPREKVLQLLKTIANSRGVQLMASRPRRYTHIRFVSRMNGFQSVGK